MYEFVSTTVSGAARRRQVRRRIDGVEVDATSNAPAAAAMAYQLGRLRLASSL